MRTLPYLRSWHERYRGGGLALIGIHSPRFPFTQDRDVVGAACARLAIDWPVAVDREFGVWKLYEPHGWPALFLWGRGGALRWYHLGEGDYADTEQEIQQAPRARQRPRVAGTIEPIRPSDVPGVQVIAPTPEVFPGGSTEEPWVTDGSRTAIELDYEAGGAYAATDGTGEIAIRVDGAERDPIDRRPPGTAGVDGPREQREPLPRARALTRRARSTRFSSRPACPETRRAPCGSRRGA